MAENRSHQRFQLISSTLIQSVFVFRVVPAIRRFDQQTEYAAALVDQDAVVAASNALPRFGHALPHVAQAGQRDGWRQRRAVAAHDVDVQLILRAYGGRVGDQGDLVFTQALGERGVPRQLPDAVCSGAV